MKKSRKIAKQNFDYMLEDIKKSFEESGDIGVGTNKMKLIFDDMDSDKNGKIDKSEFNRAMKGLKIPISKENIETIFLVYDLDGHGLDYDQFFSLLADEGDKSSKVKWETRGRNKFVAIER